MPGYDLTEGRDRANNIATMSSVRQRDGPGDNRPHALDRRRISSVSHAGPVALRMEGSQHAASLRT